ncbi:unnamed protein product, partial [Polarella glacialis]
MVAAGSLRKSRPPAGSSENNNNHHNNNNNNNKLPSFRLLSGEEVLANFGSARSVGDAKCCLAEALKVSADRLRLVAVSTCLADRGLLADISGDVVQVCVLPDPTEARLAKALSCRFE